MFTRANRGIGLAVARSLAAARHRVILGCRSLEDGEVAAAALDAKGAQVRALRLDVAAPASIDAAIAELVRDGIEVDVLVNDAGIYHRGDSFHVPMEAVRDSMEVHLIGPLALCRALIPGMARRCHGRVVNVSSGFGAFSNGLNGDAAYALSKSALNALTLKLASEVSGDVEFNAGCPGWVRTRMGGRGADRSIKKARRLSCGSPRCRPRGRARVFSATVNRLRGSVHRSVGAPSDWLRRAG